MKILSELQREALLKVIAEAPDDLLLEAANNVKQYRLTIQRNFEEIRSYVGMKAVQIGSPISKSTGSTMNPADIVKPIQAVYEDTPTPIPLVDTTLTLPTIEEPKPNVEPVGEPAGKVGSKSKDTILLICKIPKNLDQINTSLGRGKGKLEDTQALLKRLWNLNQISFDGTNYFSKA